jgi:hypothetical protein
MLKNFASGQNSTPAALHDLSINLNKANNLFAGCLRRGETSRVDHGWWPGVIGALDFAIEVWLGAWFDRSEDAIGGKVKSVLHAEYVWREYPSKEMHSPQLESGQGRSKPM